jgi:hypothetical protein
MSLTTQGVGNKPNNLGLQGVGTQGELGIGGNQGPMAQLMDLLKQIRALDQKSAGQANGGGGAKQASGDQDNARELEDEQRRRADLQNQVQALLAANPQLANMMQMALNGGGSITGGPPSIGSMGGGGGGPGGGRS